MAKVLSKKRIFIICAAIAIIVGFLVTLAVSNGTHYHTIKVEYKYMDGTRAYDDYVAVYAHGSSVDITVTNPLLPGYRAVDSTEENANPALTTRLQYNDIDEDVTVIVYYAPDAVEYRVRYFFQNVENDMYTEELSFEAWRTDRKGTTGTYPQELEEETFEGFTSLFHEPDVIASDGSTVFQIYYDRNYVLINFELEGGYGVEPVYAKYDSRYNIPEPSKSGYEFVGWRDEEGNVSKFTSGKVPSEDVTYTAVWEAVETTYTVAYWLENAEDENYDFQSSKQVTAMSGTTATGIDDWNGTLKPYAEFDHADTEVVEGDGSTVIDVYYNRKDYTLRFIYARELAGVNAYDGSDLTEQPEEGEYYIYNVQRGKFLTSTQTTITNDERLALNSVAEKFTFEKIGNNYYIRRSSDGYYLTIGDKTAHFVSTPTEITLERTNNGQYWAIIDGGYCGNAKGGNDAIGGNGVNSTYGKSSVGSRFYICPTVDTVTTNPQLCTRTSPYSNSSSNDLGTRLNAATWSNAVALPTPTGYQTYSEKIGDYVYYYITLERKYGAYIGRVWPLESMGYGEVNGRRAFFGSWNPGHGSYYVNHQSEFGNNNTIKGRYNYVDEKIMLENNPNDIRVVNLLGYWAGTKSTDVLARWIYNLYVPALAGDTVALEKDGVQYKLFGTCTTFDGNLSLAQQTPISITGFGVPTKEEVVDEDYVYEFNGQNLSMPSRTANLFYTRNSYTLQFQNVSTIEHTYSVPYQTQLSTGNYNYTPVYPDELQRRFYSFGGWYETADFIPGTEVDLTDPNLKMDSSNLSLFAKWDKVIFNVKFYDDFSDYRNGENEISSVDVAYGEYIATSEIPQSTDLTKPDPNAEFAGWYYYNEEQTKVRFDPYNLPITRDGISLFAEWSSSATGKYKVEYMERGTNNQVADSTTGTSFIGKTRTFSAKGGNELDENHAWVEGGENWWPTVSSHSILIEPNEASDPFEPNTYRFEYVKKSKVCYTVRYVNSVTGSAMQGHPDQAKETTYGIVTEDSPYIVGYIADAVTKTLVVAAGDTEEEEYQINVITFFYTENTTEALYQVNHYIQKLEDLTAYDMYRQDMRICDLNKQIDATSSATRVPGFQMQAAKTHISGSIEGGKGVANGNKLVIDLYYDRLKYGYSILYMEFGTDELLETHEYSGEEYEELMGATVHVTAPETVVKDNKEYVRVGDAERSFEIRAQNSQNTLHVYYMERNMYNIKYQAISLPELGEDYGTITKSLEVVNNVTLIEGSTAMQTLDNADRDKYTFIGWFRDPECTQPVPAEMIHDTYTIIPNVLADATYFAGFKRIGGKLSITETGGNTGDSFLYRIHSDVVDITISVGAGETVTIENLPTGTYTVEEIPDWSWKYEAVGDSTTEVEVVKDDGKTEQAAVTFEHTAGGKKWLGGESHRNNHFGDAE